MKKTTMKKSILSIILAVAALTATAQNTYTLNFDPVLLSEELSKEDIMNTQAIASELYGIDAIPEIILFAPDGTILARGLRGNEIEKKLAEIFGESKSIPSEQSLK